MNETYFQLDHVCKSFHTVKAVNDVSCSIGKGEVHAICGENGAGKSTMMNLIAGVYRIDSGEMRLDGQVYDPKNPADARRAGVSIVFQELSMFSPADHGDEYFRRQGADQGAVPGPQRDAPPHPAGAGRDGTGH